MSIQDKFNRANVIYKITRDIDLGGGTLTIPEGCTLDFQGGSFSNGILNISSDNYIAGNNTVFNDVRIIISKSVKNIKIKCAKFIGNKVLNCEDKALLVYGILQAEVVLKQKRLLV